MRVPLASSGLRPQDVAAVIKVLNSGNLTMGNEVKEFERAMAEYLKVKHFVMVNSGSSANLAIFEALLRPSKSEPRLKRGDGVLVPAVAWPTTIWPIVQLGLIPVFVDIELNTIALDIIDAKRKIRDSKIPIKAIFPIHPLGYSIDGQKLNQFAIENDLILINDVCESLGSWDGHHHAGTTGVAASFSFYFSHHITTMEGGGVATNDDFVADDLRSIRSHGWSRDRFDVANWTQNSSQTDAKFMFVTTGYNIRPMEIQAAIGQLQIADIDLFIKKRRETANKITHALKDSQLNVVDCGVFSGTTPISAHSWMLIPLRVQGSKKATKKAKILEYLKKNEIETRPVLTGNFLSQPAIGRIDGEFPPANSFPNASEITESYFMIGNHHDFSEDQVNYLILHLIEAAKHIK